MTLTSRHMSGGAADLSTFNHLIQLRVELSVLSHFLSDVVDHSVVWRLACASKMLSLA